MSSYFGGKSPLLNVMTRAILKASKGLIRDFGELENLQVSRKGTRDFVTASDLRAEKILREELEKARPGFSFLMEESGRVAGTDLDNVWLIDPLDGTKNFIHGMPHFAISVALQSKGEVVAAAVYAPITDDMYLAEKGAGAFYNDRRLRVAAREDLSACLLASSFTGVAGKEKEKLDQFQRLNQLASGIRCLGCASLDLAYVAAGRLDGFWGYGLKPWDLAAGMLLVTEAGGTVAGLSQGNPLETNDIVAANPKLAPTLKTALVG